jgi:hypothetical protein
MVTSLSEILARVTPGSGKFRCGIMAGGAFIQYAKETPCSQTGQRTTQRGRKWYISRFMTEDEIFRTCLLAVRVFEEHEVYERFRVDGRRYLGPHPEGQRVEGEITWETLY